MGRMEEGENMDVGDQILELREQTQMTLEELALGVCTPESLRNIELGKETVSKLFMEIMYQRLGKSTDKLELIVSKEVYEEEEQWEQFEEYLERGDKESANKILDKFLASIPEESNVHKMFYCRNRAYAELRVENNPIQAKEWMKKALDITMPGWRKRPIKEYRISTIEMENLLAYAKAQLVIGTDEEIAEAEVLLLACKQFIDERISDEEEHTKIFAKCAHLLAGLYLQQEKQEQAKLLAERAFRELQSYGISYFMEPILKILVDCEDGDIGEKVPQYQKYLTALQHVKQYVGEEWHFTDSIFKNCSQQTYYIDHELFREERIAQGYSQEQMIEGIYKNPESLSRAEKGKVTMRDSRLIRLFRKLGIEKCRYNGFVVTDKYEDLELKQQIDILISRNCDAEAGERLEELKSRLDLSIAENRRTIQGYEIAIGIEKEEVPKEELLKRAENLLEETYRWKSHGAYRPPMDREASLINLIGILLLELGKKEEAKQLLQNITEAMKKSKVDMKRRSRQYGLLRSNLAKLEQSISVAKNNIQFTIACGKLRTLPMDYLTIACAMIDT
ncbi:MAG: helix-turn-helix transcriptional regulator, partial [Lachnospiraceae bacterium]|nr:helix-turn-helix transcriptional regulator [Lachnospiraceae bacterium]